MDLEPFDRVSAIVLGIEVVIAIASLLLLRPAPTSRSTGADGRPDVFGSLLVAPLTPPADQPVGLFAAIPCIELRRLFRGVGRARSRHLRSASSRFLLLKRNGEARAPTS